VEPVDVSVLDEALVVKAAKRCKKHTELPQQRLQVSYDGEINGGFVGLIGVVTEFAPRAGFEQLDLDISSGGGEVDAAIQAGELMADSGWNVSILDRGHCYSACVLVLAAGDSRQLGGGEVGIHRIIPDQSSARTRVELDRELEFAVARVKLFLRQQGVDPTLADLMMTTPSGQIRILSPGDLEKFGLGPQNAAQADLLRIAFVNRCGREFVEKTEAFGRDANTCFAAGALPEEMDACYKQKMAEHGLEWLDCDR
jgi:hypothetical protein